MASHTTTTNDSDSGSKLPEILMHSRSRYAGQVADSASRRSIEIPNFIDRVELIGAEDSQCIIDYFYHAGKFWRAIVNLDGVDQVCGQTFNFSKPKTRKSSQGEEVLFDKQGLPQRSISILNHVQSRFRMKSDHPIELYPLGSQEFAVPVHRIFDVIYSLEAVGPPGIYFNFWDGLKGNLLSAHRIMSIQEMVFERIFIENQEVMESPPLPLTESEKRALLIGSLLHSNRAGMSEQYFLYRLWGTNNCTSSPFQILDHVVNYRWPQRLGSILYRLPLNPRFYLKVRGLDADPSYRKLVRSEFEDDLNGIDFQQRIQDCEKTTD